MRIVNFFISPDWSISQYWNIKSLRFPASCMWPLSAQLRGAPHRSTTPRSTPRRSAVLRTDPRCCASLRSTSCRSAVLRLAPLRSSAPRCCATLPPLRLAAPRSAPLWCCAPLPPVRAAALCSAPLRRFARIQCRPGRNPGMPRDGLASSGWISMAYAVRGRGREAGR